mmetsp:Transcript_41432/g.65708  ORF Transcript_41432/g.65708 Transcript_41432/m.65708 type:complete len:201 (+) Transcript_41432:191-793(+)
MAASSDVTRAKGSVFPANFPVRSCSAAAAPGPGAKNCTSRMVSSAPRPSAVGPLERKTMPPVLDTPASGKTAQAAASSAPLLGRRSPRQTPFMLPRPAALAAPFKALAAGISFPCTRISSTKKPPSGLGPDLATSRLGPIFTTLSRKAASKGSEKARPTTPSCRGRLFKHNGASLEPPPEVGTPNSMFTGSTTSSTGCRC